jgi:hypothetical protein
VKGSRKHSGAGFLERERERERERDRQTDRQTETERELLTDLRPVDTGCVTVTHGADVKSSLTLKIALSVKLLSNPVCPLAVKVQRLGGIAQVGTVD